MEKTISLRDLDIPLDRDIFLRTLIRELAGVLEWLFIIVANHII